MFTVFTQVGDRGGRGMEMCWRGQEKALLKMGEITEITVGH